jgi:hypothetical protein
MISALATQECKVISVPLSPLPLLFLTATVSSGKLKRHILKLRQTVHELNAEKDDLEQLVSEQRTVIEKFRLKFSSRQSQSVPSQDPRDTEKCLVHPYPAFPPYGWSSLPTNYYGEGPRFQQLQPPPPSASPAVVASFPVSGAGRSPDQVVQTPSLSPPQTQALSQDQPQQLPQSLPQQYQFPRHSETVTRQSNPSWGSPIPLPSREASTRAEEEAVLVPKIEFDETEVESLRDRELEKERQRMKEREAERERAERAREMEQRERELLEKKEREERLRRERDDRERQEREDRERREREEREWEVRKEKEERERKEREAAEEDRKAREERLREERERRERDEAQERNDREEREQRERQQREAREREAREEKERREAERAEERRLEEKAKEEKYLLENAERLEEEKRRKEAEEEAEKKKDEDARAIQEARAKVLARRQQQQKNKQVDSGPSSHAAAPQVEPSRLPSPKKTAAARNAFFENSVSLFLPSPLSISVNPHPCLLSER